MKTLPSCSCGCVEAHVIARRVTADGIRVEVWSDGTLTQRGFILRGLGTPRSAWAVSARARAARLVMDDIGLYDVAELPKVLKTATATYAHTYSSEDTRRGHVRALVGVALAIGLTACGPDGFYAITPMGDAAPDALEAKDTAPSSDAADERDADAAPDTKTDADAACALSGSAECSSAITTYCARYAACCQQFPGNGKCTVGFDVPATCKAFYTQNGFDCSSGKYAKTVCGASAACENATSTAACSAMFVSSGPSESSFAMCPAFWGQF